jgi:hypothetical protein
VSAGPKEPRARLGVLLDGEPLPEAEARAFWTRFSDWMDANKGDLAGFAKSEGLASVHPTMQDGRAVLVASRSAPQKAYTNAPTVKSGIRSPGGSSSPQGAGARNSKARHANGKAAKK